MKSDLVVLVFNEIIVKCVDLIAHVFDFLPRTWVSVASHGILNLDRAAGLDFTVKG